MNEGEKSEAISFGEYILDARRRTLFRNETSVPMNAKAFDLLCFLAQNAGRIISKEEMLDSVWTDQFVEESNLTVQISAIRKALGDNAGDPRYLATIPGKGYQFIAEIASPKEQRTVAISTTVTNEAPEIPGIPKPATANRPVYISAGIAAAVFLLVLGFYTYPLFFANDRPVTSIAILPFTEEMKPADGDFLSDGLSERVIDALSRIPDLKVLSRDSSFRLRDSGQDAIRIGEILSVDAVLIGTVGRNAGEISIRSEMVSTKDNSVIWSDTFTRSSNDLGLLQNDVADSIAAALKFRFSRSNEALSDRPPTTDAEAYQLYLTGKYHLNRFTDDGFRKGRDSFRVALEKDRDFALAHAGLAQSYNLLCGWGAMAPNDGYPLAKAAAIRAIEIDEALPDAHLALGTVKLFYDMDWRGAEKELKRTIELNPNHSDALMIYGLALTLKGRFQDARPYILRSLELDPLSIIKLVSTGNIAYFERDHARATAEYQRAVDMDPNSGLARWSLGNALLAFGRIDDAISEYQRAITLSGDSPDEPASLAFAYAISGRKEEARKMMSDLASRQRSYLPPALAASVYGAMGENDAAFEELERAFRERDSVILYLKVDPMFDPLRSDPRFSQYLKRSGFE